jgi:hypothetical protein
MFRNTSRIALSLAVALVLVGCTAPMQMYDGERRSIKDVAILDVNSDCGVRVIAIDSVRATEADVEGGRPYFRKKLTLLPGRHTLEVYYELTRYTQGDHAVDITQRSSRSTLPAKITYYSTNYKRLTVDVKAGGKYTLDAECQPLDWPWGAMTWGAWLIEGNSGTQIATATED